MYLLALVIPSKTQFILSALQLAVWLLSYKGFPESKQPGRRLQDTRRDQISGDRNWVECRKQRDGHGYRESLYGEQEEVSKLRSLAYRCKVWLPCERLCVPE